MTDGPGTVALWAWHAASELGIHRLDVEAALGHPYTMTPAHAHDAITYSCQYFLPAMRRVTGTDPGRLSITLTDTDAAAGASIESTTTQQVAIEGPGVQVLLALWGRSHQHVHVLDGDPEVFEHWTALPGQAFQVGTWD